MGQPATLGLACGSLGMSTSRPDSQPMAIVYFSPPTRVTDSLSAKAIPLMEVWEKSIRPTPYDYGGEVLVGSNCAGKNPDNFFYNICSDLAGERKGHIVNVPLCRVGLDLKSKLTTHIEHDCVLMHDLTRDDF